MTVLQKLPFVLPFLLRVSLFKQYAETKAYTRSYNRILPNNQLHIRRTHFIEDSFYWVTKLGDDFAKPFQVVFIDSSGVPEPSIDLGGVMKEFLELLCRKIFASDYGIFLYTHQNLLYPNPSFKLIPDYLQTINFIGKIIAKLIIEGILVNIRFAPFFWSQVLNKYSCLSDLASLDEQLYKNLLFVKTFDGNVEDLCLTFSLEDNSLGSFQVID